MKILEVCDYAANYEGNFIPSLKEFAKTVEKDGHVVVFVFSNRNNNDLFKKWEIPFSQIFKTYLVDFASKNVVNEIREIIKENNINLVHGHFLSSKIFSDIKRKSQKDITFYQHIHNPFYSKKNIYAYLKRIRNSIFLAKNITKICCSDSISPTVSFSFPFSQVLCLRNAINLKRLEKSAFIRSGKLNILLFGFDYYRKGVDISIQAVTKLSKKYNVHLDIVMASNKEENINKITKEYGEIPKCISILNPTSDVTSLYKNHQIFLNASSEEGLSYANIEAYYSGLLFVSSDIPQNKEPNLPNVIYFKNRDAEDLEKALVESFSIINTYVNDVDYVEKNFSLKNWCLKLKNIFGLI